MASGFGIDLHSLHTEWRDQPKKVRIYGRRLADARKRLADLEKEEKIAIAEIDKDIRKSPSRFGIKSVTEKAISGAITLNKKWQKANEAVIDAEHHVNMLQVAMTTLEHRKKALENIVQLHFAGYYAEPKVKGNRDELVAKAAFNRKGKT